MRKRISKERREGEGGGREGPSPMVTAKLLRERTECLKQSCMLEKERIDRIIRGTSLESIKFQEIEKNCSFQQFMRKYYPFQRIKHLFTELIQRNALRRDITFMDFKLKNFLIMNNYAFQLKRIKGEDCSSGSSTKEGKHFKEMEVEVKRITKRQGTRKANHNASASFTNLLIKNIEKMLKGYREPVTPIRMEFKPILTSKALQGNDMSHNNNERLHTSPQPQHFDAYGLEHFKEKHVRKFEQISQMSCIQKGMPRSKLNTQKSQDTLRYQTEYDTEKISTRSKSKKVGVKKSMSKGKPTSKCKSPFAKPLKK